MLPFLSNYHEVTNAMMILLIQLNEASTEEQVQQVLIMEGVIDILQRSGITSVLKVCNI